MADRPIEQGNNHHCHLCQGCGHIWWHYKTDGERRAIHTCPKCGAGPYYFGYLTRRDADDDRVALKTQRASPEADTQSKEA